MGSSQSAIRTPQIHTAPLDVYLTVRDWVKTHERGSLSEGMIVRALNRSIAWKGDSEATTDSGPRVMFRTLCIAWVNMCLAKDLFHFQLAERDSSVARMFWDRYEAKATALVDRQNGEDLNSLADLAAGYASVMFHVTEPTKDIPSELPREVVGAAGPPHDPDYDREDVATHRVLPTIPCVRFVSNARRSTFYFPVTEAGSLLMPGRLDGDSISWRVVTLETRTIPQKVDRALDALEMARRLQHLHGKVEPIGGEVIVGVPNIETPQPGTYISEIQ
jgi:hypothetical protein